MKRQDYALLSPSHLIEWHYHRGRLNQPQRIARSIRRWLREREKLDRQVESAISDLFHYGTIYLDAGSAVEQRLRRLHDWGQIMVYFEDLGSGLVQVSIDSFRLK